MLFGDVSEELARRVVESGLAVLDAEGPGVRDSRLLLAELTSKTLTLGLCLLGISTPARL
ncbi:DALR anticodon-binding domain-containing protein [Amycolatopsis decaplanina]|uniref:DALR anticodon binding domain-containing protein n=1 Tax=Amycolatopsis decaplanina DSM 44594 TaxID=1284240 RepID=M2YB46_9PSEU|nr:DALR anticodon-binding domain-containing protein [Amycolatopsis decaplanina]EME52077.1 hypothetical protein H074_34998 [Amycolatopsis decaplanina DSM 44594]